MEGDGVCLGSGAWWLRGIFSCLLILDGGWTTKSPADGNKSLSLPKIICSQEVVSSQEVVTRGVEGFDVQGSVVGEVGMSSSNEVLFEVVGVFEVDGAVG